jgi:hypothetical protein
VNVAAQSSAGGAKLDGGAIAMPKSEMGEAILVSGSTGIPQNKKAQNAQTRAVSVVLKLTEPQEMILYDWVSGQNMGYHEIMQEAKMLFNK